MAGKIKDLTCKVYDNLTVLEFVRVVDKVAIYSCLCACGVITERDRSYLSRKFFKSCGCVDRKGAVYNKDNPAYNSWVSMKQRCKCTDHSQKSYKNYYLNGITYTNRWELFKDFFNDMGERPEGFSLDRIDNKLGYYKDNCRWADKRVQSFNKNPVTGTSSQYRGVSYLKEEGVWRAYFKHKGYQKHLGRYNEEIDAAVARDNYVLSQPHLRELLGSSFKDYLNFKEVYDVSI